MTSVLDLYRIRVAPVCFSFRTGLILGKKITFHLPRCSPRLSERRHAPGDASFCQRSPGHRILFSFSMGVASVRITGLLCRVYGRIPLLRHFTLRLASRHVQERFLEKIKAAPHAAPLYRPQQRLWCELVLVG